MINLLSAQMTFIPLVYWHFTIIVVKQSLLLILSIQTSLFRGLSIHLRITLVSHIVGHATTFCTYTRTISGKFWLLIIKLNHFLPFSGRHLETSLLHMLNVLHVLLILNHLLILRRDDGHWHKVLWIIWFLNDLEDTFVTCGWWHRIHGFYFPVWSSTLVVTIETPASHMRII